MTGEMPWGAASQTRPRYPPPSVILRPQAEESVGSLLRGSFLERDGRNGCFAKAQHDGGNAVGPGFPDAPAVPPPSVILRPQAEESVVSLLRGRFLERDERNGCFAKLSMTGEMPWGAASQTRPPTPGSRPVWRPYGPPCGHTQTSCKNAGPENSGPAFSCLSFQPLRSSPTAPWT